MLDNLMRAGCYASIIAIGYCLRRLGFFKEGDFSLLSRIVLKITLPAAIISNFSGKELDVTMLALILVGMAPNVVYILTGYLTEKRFGRERQAFSMQNLQGYNIGNFTMPFIQGFLGAEGVISASLFDVGSSVFSLGGAYSFAALVKENKGFSVKRIGKTLICAVAFDTYVIMTALSLLDIRLPEMAVSLAKTIGDANIFLSMLMLGVGLKLPSDKSRVLTIVKMLSIRYGWALLFALAAYYLLPFPAVVRQTMVFLLFAPMAGASPAFTDQLGLDVGLASAVNSCSVICSVLILTVLSAVIL